jgi:flagellar hook-basal body complex protein FliE
MAGSILPISGAPSVDAIRPAGAARTGSAFQDVFSSAIQTVESFGRDASGSVDRFLSGEGEELHTAIMATQRAEMAFDLFMQARNKVVNAYQEVMRMQM